VTAGIPGCGAGSESDVPDRGALLSAVGEVRVMDFEPGQSLTWIGLDAIAIPDPLGGRVVLYDRHGVQIGVRGRHGQGPGEFAFPLRVYGSRSGELFVADSRPSRVTYFSADPEPVVKISPPIPGMLLQILSGDASRVDLAWYDPASEPRAKVGFVEFGAATIRERFGIHGGDVNPEPGAMPAVVMDDEGIVYAGYGTVYQIQKYAGDGSPVATYGRTLRPILPSEADVERFREQVATMAIAGMEVERGLVEEAVSTFRRTALPFFTPSSLAVDDQRRLWVATTGPAGDSTRIDVFEADHEPMQVRVRDRVLAIAIRGSHVAILVERDLGLKGIDLYEMNW